MKKLMVVFACAFVCVFCLSDMTLTDGREVGVGRGAEKGVSFLFVLERRLLLIGWGGDLGSW